MATKTRPRRRILRPFTYAFEWASEPVIYGFPVGRIRVLEGRLLGIGRLERLIEASDFAEQRRILAETSYGDLFSDAKTSSEVEDALDAALDRAYDFMEESRLPEPIIEFFRIRHDFLNLRMLLKTRLAGAPVPERWTVHGSVPVSVFEEAAKAGDDWAKKLPGSLAVLAAQVEREVRALEATGAEAGVAGQPLAGGPAGPGGPGVGVGPSPGAGASPGAVAAHIDALVDKALFERIGEIVQSQPSQWFRELGQLMIDLANLRIVLRSRRFGKDEQWLRRVIIEGGHIPPETVRENAFGPLDELRDEIRATLGPQPQRAERALERVVLEPDKMDVVTDNIVQEMAKSGRRKANGLEPIVSYLLAVENEIKLLRIVLLGKLANIPPERLHEHVRELYA
ncbi:MAG: hypothetical protein C4521_02100 [Actinobacteria bacterium]|nr:MAG: hypothetical protein C4521_02100 [Actinomycetota bacterium]